MKYEFFEVKDVKEYILGLSKEQLSSRRDGTQKQNESIFRCFFL